MSEPTTAGRALLDKIAPANEGASELHRRSARGRRLTFAHDIAAIEAEARAAALAEVGLVVEGLGTYRYILPSDDETTPTRKHQPFDMLRRDAVLACLARAYAEVER